MTLREKLLDRLKPLLRTGQFEELCFRLDVDVIYLPGPQATPIQRAIELIRWAEQDAWRLGRLQKLIDDFDRFKEFLPEGAYPVGRELRECEEAPECQAMKEAEARGEDPEDYRVTPEKFYTFRPEAAWLGVFRGWDVPRSFHVELVQRVMNAIYGLNNCPAAAIIGSGGSGKSVALRRLAVDLAERGNKVWWVKNPEQLLPFGLTQLSHIEDGPHFLLVDDIHDLDDKYVQRFQRDLQKNRFLILVVAGRSLPAALRARVNPGAGLFEPDEAADRVSILEKIAETIPAWAETARQLAAVPLREARLIRILVVLARQKATPRNLQELEMAFLEILADDVKRIIKNTRLPGLAEAVIDTAAIREVGRDISRETLIALADHHQPGAAIPALLEEINGDRRWQALAPLLSYDSEYDVVRFHHDELAEGLILAGQRGLLEMGVIGDDTWRRATLDVVMSQGSMFSSSYALSGFVRNHPGLISKERALGYIRQLLAAGNSHHAYLRLIVDEGLALEQQERLDLLLAVAKAVPFNRWLWGTVWVWIQHHYQKKEQRSEVLEKLYQAGCRAYNILIPLLRCLVPKTARGLAREWLADPATHPNILCSSLDLLGEEAKEEAKGLLADPATHPHVLCRCLDLLGEEAKEEAKRFLADPATHPEVLCRCLDLLGEEAEEEAKRLLADSAAHPDVLCRCLDLLGEEAKEEAKRFLADSAAHPNILCSSLDLLGEEAREEAKRLLADSAAHPDVLCRCLDLLGEEAKEEAKGFLADPATQPEVLCRCLDLLGEEAKPFAIERIRCWIETNPALLLRCFQVAGAAPEAQKAAEEMLAGWDDIPPMLRVAALRAPFDTPLRIQQANEVLSDWVKQYRSLVTAALTAYWKNPDDVIKYCKAIINRWHKEIIYRIKHHQRRYDGHIIKALSHPALRSEAFEAVQDMLITEAKSPGFLSAELRQQAENIMQEQWPLWSEPQEEMG